MNNGSAPPDPANVFDASDGLDLGDHVGVANVGCLPGPCVSPGAPTAVAALARARIGSLATWQSSTAEIAGARLEYLDAYGSSGIVVADVNLGYSVGAWESAHVTMSGGYVGEDFGAHNDGSVTISGGTIGLSVYATDNATGLLSGGDAWELVAYHSAWLTWRGGTLRAYDYSLTAYNSATVEIVGSDFAVDGVQVGYTTLTPGDAASLEGRVSGTLASGESFDQEFYLEDEGRLVLSPADFVIDAVGDEGDALPGDQRCATPENLCTLRAALEEANALPGEQTVYLPPGTYPVGATIEIHDSLRLIGAGPEEVVLTSDPGVPALRAFEDSLHVSGIGLRNGGLDMLETTALIADCAMSGAAGIEGIYSDATVRRCSFGEGSLGVLGHEASYFAIEDSVLGNGSGGVTTSGGGGNAVHVLRSRIDPGVDINDGSGSLIEDSVVGPSGCVDSSLDVRSSSVRGDLYSYDCDLVVVNSTVLDGGIQFDSEFTSLQIEASTQAGSGGLDAYLGDQSTLDLRNSIVSGYCAVTASAGSSTASSYNLIGDADACGILPGPGDEWGTGASPLDPQLGPVTEYDLALFREPLAGSPAVDAGDPGLAFPGDQRGVVRPLDGDLDGSPVADIGAVEAGAAAGCSDGADNEGDGLVDFPADPGCQSLLDPHEDAACDNGIDDDGDGLVDYSADPGCAAGWSQRESTPCDDGWDNDGDGLTDAADPGCSSAVGMTESNALLNGGFELSEPTTGALPTAVGDWSGDYSEIVGAENGIEPYSGGRMLHIVYTGAQPGGGGGSFAQLRQLVDVRSFLASLHAGETVWVDAAALFNRVPGDADTDTEFQVILDAFAGDLPSYPQQSGAGTQLIRSIRVLETDSDPSTWEEARAGFALPADADFLAVQVLARENVVNDTSGEELDGHYADEAVVVLRRIPVGECHDGADNDGDGRTDWPEDPGCRDAAWLTEAPECQDGVDNDPAQDAAGLVDFDGGQSIHGACSGGVCPPGVSDPDADGVADPDPQCVGKPWRNAERRKNCGLGAELVGLIAAVWMLRRQRLTRMKQH